MPDRFFDCEGCELGVGDVVGLLVGRYRRDLEIIEFDCPSVVLQAEGGERITVYAYLLPDQRLACDLRLRRKAVPA